MIKQNIETTKVNYNLFLEEGKTYLKNLISKLEQKYKLIEYIDMKYKFLINLGDLERYSSLSSNKRNWASSQK